MAEEITVSYESLIRHEVRGFTYRFRVGIDEGVFECDRCGSLVTYLSINKHRHWHTLIAPLLGSP